MSIYVKVGDEVITVQGDQVREVGPHVDVAGKFVERKPPRTVDAFRWSGSNLDAASKWLKDQNGDDRVESFKLDPDDSSVLVMWDDGDRLQARSGSWIVQDCSGTIVVHSDEVFRKLYDYKPLQRCSVCSNLYEALAAYQHGPEAIALRAAERIGADEHARHAESPKTDAVLDLRVKVGDEVVTINSRTPLDAGVVITEISASLDRQLARFPETAASVRASTDHVLASIAKNIRRVVAARDVRDCVPQELSESRPNMLIDRIAVQRADAEEASRRSRIITIQVGDEVVHVAAPAESTFPVDVVETAISNSRTRQGVQLPIELSNQSLKVALGDGMRELTLWQKWASDLLREEPPKDLVLGGELLRKKITSVVEAPSVVEVDDDLRSLGAGDQLVMACCRVANEVYRAGLQDPFMRTWDLTPLAERAEIVESVVAAMSGVTPEQWHRRWCEKMTADGWKYDPIKDDGLKTHPNLVEYASLPSEQRVLDRAFVAAVLSTVRAVSDLRDAYLSPVLYVKGPITQEQIDEFKRAWHARVKSPAWKTPIYNTGTLFDSRSVMAFIDEQIDSMTSNPMMWGRRPFLEVELQVLLLLEVRAFIIAGKPLSEAVAPTYAAFVVSKIGEQGFTSEPLTYQLDKLGRVDEFSAMMVEFVALQRVAHADTLGIVEADAAGAGSRLAGPRERARLVALFEKRCECRPTNTARLDHSHDCDTDTTDDVRVVLHRVVRATPGDMSNSEHRAATDREVQEARARIGAEAIWEGINRDLNKAREGKS